MSGPRRFWIRTHGCQMNVHDSEKVANLLLHDGWEAAPSSDAAELLILNTCSIRDKAEHRLYSELGLLREWKQRAPGRIVGVAGCVAQQQGDALLRRFAQLDFVFGTHNLRRVPALAAAALRGVRDAQTQESRALERFDLPARHPSLAGDPAGRAFVTVMEGCDMFCSFCIVPTTRGREISRPGGAIVAEARELVASGIREITLLGQTVNAYGRHARRRAAAREESAPQSFADLLREIAALPGLARLRYISPHPIFFDAELVRAHRELEPLCPHVHLPVQSGSDRILERMRRRYDADTYRRLVGRLREARPDLAITTDLIVGFPGETDADFEKTLELVREVEFTDLFSFKYSSRPGTAAARFEDAVPEAVAQARLERLQEVQRALTLRAHRARVGSETEILVEGASRRAGAQLSGRDPFHRVVNFSAEAHAVPAPGSLIRVRIVDATPHSLIASWDRGLERECIASVVKLRGPAADERTAAIGN
ncbi:MAG TPA: tRNA (N6-isopentenyl adenosine(37)-C2)-methylthiotransferase MiaB [Myxococcota bacterium]|nr:tRNA (N6-isopentenyl adenosine(37)-C2)-methylthiotransferase MiaB [Myxococcota bacterium]